MPGACSSAGRALNKKKVEDKLKAKGMLKTKAAQKGPVSLSQKLIDKAKDPRLFYVEGLGSHPPDYGQCWIYHPLYHFVAKGQILKKTPGTVDTHATWDIKILEVEDMQYRYYKDVRETCTRSQIWPTKRECYIALREHLERKVKQNLKDNKRFEERCNRIERFIR